MFSRNAIGVRAIKKLPTSARTPLAWRLNVFCRSRREQSPTQEWTLRRTVWYV